jgi:hypothetical protein
MGTDIGFGIDIGIGIGNAIGTGCNAIGIECGTSTDNCTGIGIRISTVVSTGT